MKITQEHITTILTKLTESTEIDQFSLLNLLLYKEHSNKPHDSLVEYSTSLLLQCSVQVNRPDIDNNKVASEQSKLDSRYFVSHSDQYVNLLSDAFYDDRRVHNGKRIPILAKLHNIIKDEFNKHLLEMVILNTESIPKNCFLSGYFEVDVQELDFRFIVSDIIMDENLVNSPNFDKRINVLLNNNTSTRIGNINLTHQLDFGLTLQYLDRVNVINHHDIDRLKDHPKSISQLVFELLSRPSILNRNR